MPFSEKSPLDLFADRLSLLSPLSDEARLAIAAIGGRPHQTRANADILRITPKSDHACLMIAGLAGRFDQLRDGERQITALHLAGDMVGLQAVVAPGVYFPTQALGISTVLCVPLSGLRGVAAVYPEVARAFWAYTALDGAVLAKWAANLGRKSAMGRMAHLLCELGLRMEPAGQGSRFEYVLEATQIHLADALGLTSVHVNRTLKSLREAGLISQKGRTVRIENWPALAAAGDFDPDYLQIQAHSAQGATPSGPVSGPVTPPRLDILTARSPAY